MERIYDWGFEKFEIIAMLLHYIFWRGLSNNELQGPRWRQKTIANYKITSGYDSRNKWVSSFFLKTNSNEADVGGESTPVTLITKSDHIWPNRRYPVPNRGHIVEYLLKMLSEKSDLVHISNADLVRPFWACIFSDADI